MAKRKPLLTAQTTAVRLFDGFGDGMNELLLESFAGNLLVSTAGPSLPKPVREWLAEQGFPSYWKQLDQHQKASPTHLSGGLLDKPFLVLENGMHLEISFQSGYSQGVFLDQRDNRQQVRQLMGKGLRLLNTFAYTGAFSVAAALAGAETTTLDLSQPYLEWAKRNFAHNQLEPGNHHFCRGDAFHWLKRFEKQNRKFDGIILDPPTFSRDEKGTIFRAEEHFGELAALAARLLEPDGWLLCSTNCRRITLNDFQRQLRVATGTRFQARSAPMPADFTDEPYLKSVWLRS